MCNFREIDEIIVRDVGDKILDDGRWPLLIDRSKQVATFFRYASLPGPLAV